MSGWGALTAAAGARRGGRHGVYGSRRAARVPHVTYRLRWSGLPASAGRRMRMSWSGEGDKLDGVRIGRRRAVACGRVGSLRALTAPERCPSGRRGTPGERVYPQGTEGSNPSLSAHPGARALLTLRPWGKADTLGARSAGVGRWRLGPAQEGVANPVRSGRKQRYRMSSCAAGCPSRHRRAPGGGPVA